MNITKEEMAKLISQKPIRYAENPYWTMQDNQIWDKQHQSIFDLRLIKQILPTLISFFQLTYDSFQTESQVLVLCDEDYAKLSNQHIPELASPSHNHHILVLPQINTWGNTRVSEKYWQTQLVNRHITPLMRIHTHHILEAYQSSTDYNSLNSGSLEVVVGKIYDDVPQIAFWLDIRGTLNKQKVFRTLDLGEHIFKQETIHANGLERLVDDDDTKIF